jgi:hypothetical protein
MPTIAEAATSLDDLADQIRTGQEKIGQHIRNALRIAFLVGDALIQARAQVAPGQWAKWLKANCFMSQRTADLYMQLTQHRDELEERMVEVPTLSLRAAAQLIAKPRAESKKKAPPRPKSALQAAWNAAAPSERSAVLARMPLNDLLQSLPPSFRARFYASGKAAPGGNEPEGETLLRASETLRRAISLLKQPSDANGHEAAAALQALSRMLGRFDIDEITIVQRHAKAKRRAA